MFSFCYNNVGVRNVEQQRKRARSLLDESGSLFWILHIDSVHFQENVSQLDTRRSCRRSFHDEGDNGTFVQSIDNVSVRVQKEGVRQFLGFEEHNPKSWSENTRIVEFSSGRKIALLFLFLVGWCARGPSRRWSIES